MEENASAIMQTATLAIQLGVIIFAAKFGGDIAQKFKMPSVLGELIAGIAIGPFVLGALPIGFLGFPGGLFAPIADSAIPVSTLLYALATLGSVLLLFMSGLETNLQMFFRYSVVGTVVGIGGVIFSFIFGDAIGMFMLKTGFMDPRCLFLGILCTATSVGITARILSEKRSIDSPEGVTILAAAVIDDVLGIVCLAIVIGIVAATTGTTDGAVDWGNIGKIAVKSFGIWLGATVIGLFVARHIARFLRKFNSAVVFGILAFAMALMVAGLFEHFGLAMIIGAYVMGLSLSKTDVSFAIQRALAPLYNFMVPVFFVVMGMTVDIKVLADPAILTLGVVYSVLAILAKIIGCAIPAFFMNFNLLGAFRIGAGMVPRGEVALIIAGIGAATMMTVNGVQIPILNSQLFGVAIIMTLSTTLVAPPLLAFALNIRGKGVRKEIKDHTAVHTTFAVPSETAADFVIKSLIESFESEGFMLSELEHGGDGSILQLRRDSRSFSMMRKGNQFIFESTADNVLLIKAVMYETFLGLHHTMGKLKDLASPTKLQNDFFNGVGAQAKQASSNDKDLPLYKILPFACVTTKLKSKTKNEMIVELLDLVESSNRIVNRSLCESDLMDRESIVSSGMQEGVAMPHCRTDGVNELVAAIGIAPDGCDFDSSDGKPSKIFILCLSPKTTPGPILQFMARIAGNLTTKEKRTAILAAHTPEELRDIILGRKI